MKLKYLLILDQEIHENVEKSEDKNLTLIQHRPSRVIGISGFYNPEILTSSVIMSTPLQRQDLIVLRKIGEQCSNKNQQSSSSNHNYLSCAAKSLKTQNIYIPTFQQWRTVVLTPLTSAIQ